MKKVSLLLTFSFIMALWIAPAAPAQSQEAQPASLLATMQADTGGRTVIEYHAETGMARFIGTDPNHPIPLDKTVFGENADAEQAAMHFLASYGSLFGLADPAEDLRLRRTTRGEDGGTYLRYQQVYRGIPVFAGELVVGTTSSKAVASANGEALPGIDLDIEPAVDAETARRTALQKTARIYELDPEELVAGQPELWIYNPALLGGPGMRVTSLVWRVEVEPLDLSPIRELVLVDAHSGLVVLHFNRNPGALYREIYDNNNTTTALPGTLIRVEGGATSSITDVNQAYNFLGDTYNFYKNIHGRDSIDGKGMKLKATVRHCVVGYYCPLSNAYWNGNQVVFGQGYAAADDVAAHELTHGVTEYESDLAYYMQPGAINESLSDIWGEFVDWYNNGAVPDSHPWLIGEDLPIGAIRNMKDPTNPPNVCTDTQTTGCNPPQPDMMTSPDYYCGTEDYGGVHINSGVGNKAAYLMAAGGSFNGKVVTGIGIEKTAKIWYHVQTNMLTSGSDYQDLYSALIQACTSLVGTSGITTSNCQQVKNAVDAVQMNLQPASCAAPEAPVCPAGQSPSPLFSDDMENYASDNWTTATLSGTDHWFYPAIGYATSGTYHMWGNNHAAVGDSAIAMTSSIPMPAESTPYLHFKHAYSFALSDDDKKYDGGVIEYSTDNGANWYDAGTIFPTVNGYTGALHEDNPLGERQAFTGVSNGYHSTRLDLSPVAGQSVRFRFRMGTDGLGKDYGWFIDDVNIYTCSSNPAVNLIYLPLAKKEKPPPTTFTSVADADVFEGYPTYASGSDEVMWVGYDKSELPYGKTVRGYIKFDLSEIPIGKAITSADLKLYYMESWDYPNTYRTITAYRVSGPWTESAITWNTRPPFAEAYGSVQIRHSYDAFGYYTIDVTDLVRDWINGDRTNHGLVLLGPDASDQEAFWRGFSTREGDNPPVLNIVYSGASITARETSLESVDVIDSRERSLRNEAAEGRLSSQEDCSADKRCYISE